MAIGLEPRLRTVADFVPRGAALGDIGTDHAYLPLALCEAGQIKKAVAVDVHEGPYQSAVATVKRHGLESYIDVRLGDGLEPLKPGEVDVLTLAGMGGRTMLGILAAKPEVLEFVQDLILQPQNTERILRLTLLNQGWRLKAEKLAEEEARIYVIMAFSKNSGWDKESLKVFGESWTERLAPVREKEKMPEEEFRQAVQKLLWFFGPLVLEEGSELLRRHIADYIGRLERQREQMKKSVKAEIAAKIKALSGELAVAEGLRRWWQQ